MIINFLFPFLFKAYSAIYSHIYTPVPRRAAVDAASGTSIAYDYTTQAASVPSAIDGVVVREFVEIPENSTHPTELPLVTLVSLMFTPPDEAVGVIPKSRLAPPLLSLSI